MRVLLVALLALGATSVPWNDPVRLFGDDSNISVSYFEVHGDTAEEIRASLIQNGPVDPKGVHRYAVTRWSINWSWPTDKSGAADLSRASVSHRIAVVLPKLASAGGQSQDLIRKWQEFSDAIVLHESGHVLAAQRTASEILAKLVEAGKGAKHYSEDEAEAMAKEELYSLHGFDLHYDSVTKHGITQGVVLSR